MELLIYNKLLKLTYLKRSKLKSKVYYDRRGNKQNYKVGDNTLLLTHLKLADQYTGPHEILEISEYEYEIYLKLCKYLSHLVSRYSSFFFFCPYVPVVVIPPRRSRAAQSRSLGGLGKP